MAYRMNETCLWIRYQDEEDWSTSCAIGRDFIFNDDGPVENGFKFCPYCGLSLEAEILD